ncbi:MAG: hypothetical protein HYU66_29475 [Armatimonadetes bacterium]|nr:hypothetical protein [Armatimonadota bacterium]
MPTLDWHGLPLRGDPFPWLLEPSNPCVRWRTLRELLDRPDDDPEVREAADAIYRWPPIRSLLDLAADPAGYPWPAGVRRGAAQTVRDLGQLTRLGVPPGAPVLEAAAARLKEHLPDNRSSDCYLPQMVMGLLRYGDPADPDLPALVEKVIANEVLADGNRPPTGGGGSCCISHSCHSAVARALDCVASVPESRRTPSMAAFLSRGAAYLAAHRLFQKNHHRYTAIRGEYTKLHQPWALDWLTDVLDLLDIATRIGLADSPALVPALELLMAKQGADSRWALEVGYHTDRALVANLLRDIETVEGPGKWVTLTALLLLKRCAGLVRRLVAGERLAPPPEPPASGFLPYPWAPDPADEARVRAAWDTFGGMPAVLHGLEAFAGAHGLHTGWYHGFAMGLPTCREWCCSAARLVPARNIKAAFPVARTCFLAPRGRFTADGLADRLGVGLLHDYPGRIRPGSWVEKTLRHIRVDKWTLDWDTIGIAVRSAIELPGVMAVMAEALADMG